MYNVVFVHLLNDYSGSPKVLKQAVTAAKEYGNVCLYIGGGSDGFLSNCQFETKKYFYVRSQLRWVTLITYLLSQVVLFGRLMMDRSINKGTIIYINTLLPFGAGLFGYIRGLKVIYHIHEVSITPAPLRKFLTAVTQFSSSLNIYVSRAHMAALPVENVPAVCLYNALEPAFIEEASGFDYGTQNKDTFRVLMLASLRNYKGLEEFLALARSLNNGENVEFDLVLNDESNVIEGWIKARNLPGNVNIHPRTLDTSRFYRRAHVLLNLSRVDQWIETFGLTILEAMAFGIPVIVPPVGGPAELVSDGVEGFLVDSRESELLRSRLLELRNDPALCARMSRAGRARCSSFSPTHFNKDLIGILQTAKGSDGVLKSS